MAGDEPDAERQQLGALYARMRDGELEKLASDPESLTELARELLAEEIQRRSVPGEDETPADEIIPEEQQWARVRRFRDLPPALLAKGRLDSSGIECLLVDENTVRIDWFWSNAVGGIKLVVKPEDAEAAHEILSQPIPEGFEVEGIGEYRQPKCPKCGSLDVSFEGLNEAVAYGSAWIGIPLPVHDKGWRCHTCKHLWPGDERAGETPH
jgi:hypothetical protein